MKNFIICPLTKYYWGEKMKKNGTDGACSMYAGEERYVQGFGGET